jgi:hypothetical protein
MLITPILIFALAPSQSTTSHSEKSLGGHFETAHPGCYAAMAKSPHN